MLDPSNKIQFYIGTALEGVWALTLVPEVAVDVDVDFDVSGVVDFPDFLTFVAAFGLPSSDPRVDAKTDLDETGTVGFLIFLLFVAVFGN